MPSCNISWVNRLLICTGYWVLNHRLRNAGSFPEVRFHLSIPPSLQLVRVNQQHLATPIRDGSAG